MALFEKKQALGGGIKKDLGKTPSLKESKPSGFGGKPFLRREEFRNWLRKEEVGRISKMPQEERVDLEKKLFDQKKFGNLIEQKEAEKLYKDIKNFPIGSKKKYGFQSESKRVKTLKVLEKLLGK